MAGSTKATTAGFTCPKPTALPASCARPTLELPCPKCSPLKSRHRYESTSSYIILHLSTCVMFTFADGRSRCKRVKPSLMRTEFVKLWRFRTGTFWLRAENSFQHQDIAWVPVMIHADPYIHSDTSWPVATSPKAQYGFSFLFGNGTYFGDL